MKTLIVVTSVNTYQKQNVPTGLWLSEFTHFWDVLHQAGLEADIVSIKGGEVPIDPESLKPMVMDKATRAHHQDSNFMNLLKNTRSIDNVNVGGYSAIFLAGGHGTMFDFAGNEALQKLIAQFHASDKIVSAVCHGVCGLLNVKKQDGTSLIADKKVTGYSCIEEILARRHNLVPFNLETELKDEGAKYNRAVLPFLPFAIEDGNLITGQNPFSTKKVAELHVRKLKSKI
jgi:putative intracellular protease/amidase